MKIFYQSATGSLSRAKATVGQVNLPIIYRFFPPIYRFAAAQNGRADENHRKSADFYHQQIINRFPGIINPPAHQGIAVLAGSAVNNRPIIVRCFSEIVRFSIADGAGELSDYRPTFDSNRPIPLDTVKRPAKAKVNTDHAGSAPRTGASAPGRQIAAATAGFRSIPRPKMFNLSAILSLRIRAIGQNSQNSSRILKPANSSDSPVFGLALNFQS